MKLTIDLRPSPRLRMSGAIPLLPHMLSFYAQGQRYVFHPKSTRPCKLRDSYTGPYNEPRHRLGQPRLYTDSKDCSYRDVTPSFPPKYTMKYLAVQDVHSLGKMCCGEIPLVTAKCFLLLREGAESCAALIFNSTWESFWLIWRAAQARYVQDTWYIRLIILVWRRIALRPSSKEIWEASDVLHLPFVSGSILLT
jgi:hypothetical protein